MKNITVNIIPQLKDNYSYIIASEVNYAVIIDPAESDSIIKFLKKNNITLIGILITHHHTDHTSGIKDLLNFKNVDVYSPHSSIFGTTHIVFDKDIIDFEFINFLIIATPGHTLDHIVFYSKKNYK